MKKKILFILHVPPPVHGASMVGKFISESSIINQTFDTDFINLSTTFSIDDIGKSSFKKIFYLLRIQAKVFKALTNKNYDLCYVTLNAAGISFYKDLFIVAILKLFGKKIIYHFHNKGISTSKETWLNKTLYTYAFNKTKSILLSPSLFSDFKKYLQIKDVYFCANGIPLQTNTHSNICRLKATNQVCNLLFLSNMIQEKGVMVLLEACKILQASGLHFNCHFVGAWTNISEKQFYAYVNSNHLEQNVYAHGPKFADEKINFFSTSDIFVLPTYYKNESFPLVLLEAMSYGLPIVSTMEGGISDIVTHGKTGFIVQQRNAEDLAVKLEILIKSSQLREQFGIESKKKFMQFFTIQSFESNMVKILETASH